ncbi:glycosyltransferase family 47 protein [Atractiella rhizophila]|nr:glycosyltransferase family 47 protein [Atractiella rhizophila]
MLTIRPPLLRSRLTTRLLLLLALALVVLHITFPFSPSYQATLEAHGVVGAVGRASDKGRKLLGDGWRKAMEYGGWELDTEQKKGRKRGRKLFGKGDLAKLVSSTAPSQGQKLYDQRSSADKLRLSSSRFLPTSFSPSSLPTTTTRRSHILVTGGFGSLGRHVIREILFRNKERQQSAVNDLFFEDDWESGSARLRDPLYSLGGEAVLDALEEDDVVVTILDVRDRREELDWLLKHEELTRGRLRAWEGKRAGMMEEQGEDDQVPVDPRTTNFAGAEISLERYIKSGKVRIVIGDVRNDTLMSEIFQLDSRKKMEENQRIEEGLMERGGAGEDYTGLGEIEDQASAVPPISGIIHFAGYGTSCNADMTNCIDVGANGTQALLNAMESAERLPWLLVSSHVDPVQLPIQLVRNFASLFALHSIDLTLPPLSNLFGDVFSSHWSPITDIMHKALADAPIHFETASVDGSGFMSYTAVASTVADAVDMLDAAGEADYVRQMAFVSDVEVSPLKEEEADGKVGIEGIALRIVHLTKSDSPMQIMRDRRPFPPSRSRKTLSRTLQQQLGSAPTMPLHLELKGSLSEILAQQADYLSSSLSEQCGAPPSVEDLEEGLLNLDRCQIQLLTVLEGTIYGLGCPSGSQRAFAVQSAVPLGTSDHISSVQFEAERDDDGRIVIHLSCPRENGNGFDNLVYEEETMSFLLNSQAAGKRVTRTFYAKFVHRESRTFTISLDPEDTHPSVTKGPSLRHLIFNRVDETADDPSHSLETVFEAKDGSVQGSPILFKANPICCRSGGSIGTELYDFAKDDPLATSIIYFPSNDGRTSLTDSTYTNQICRRIKAESDQVRRLQAWFKDPASDMVCHRRRAEVTTWAPSELPLCHTKKDAPVSCMASEECRCSYDQTSAGPPMRSSWSIDNIPSESENRNQSSMSTRVNAVPIATVISPIALNLFQSPPDRLVKPHVVEIADLDVTDCYQFENSTLPLAGEYSLISSLNEISTTQDKADFTFVPFFQNCYNQRTNEDVMSKFVETLGKAEAYLSRTGESDRLSATRVVVPFMGSFGSCVSSDFDSPPPPLEQEAISVQTLGGYNSGCVKDRDVVLPQPAVPMLDMIANYETVNDLVASSARSHLAFFAGTSGGLGTLVRKRLECSLNGKEGVLWQELSQSKGLLQTMADAKFCVLPRGKLGGIDLLPEAVWVGCIPVFVYDRNHLPFADIINYSAFSISVPELSTSSIYAVLQSFPSTRLDQMQAAMLKVREAFVYRDSSEWERKGPIHLALVSLSLRLGLRYPLFTVENC